MSDTKHVFPCSEKQLSSEQIKNVIRSECEKLISFCTGEYDQDVCGGMPFFEFEKKLKLLIASPACLFVRLFLTFSHENLNYSEWTDTGLYYARKTPIARVIKTVFGEVKYWRTYLVRKENTINGFHPLDSVLGMTRDGFSPSVISLVTRLATRVSFGTTVLIFTNFFDWSPSTESIATLVLGIGRDADTYMETAEPSEGDGEVLIIECDGKATPTATEEELNKRRGKRNNQRSCCQRHRGKKNGKNANADVVKKEIRAKTVVV